jgi:hypothetical protein
MRQWNVGCDTMQAVPWLAERPLASQRDFTQSSKLIILTSFYIAWRTPRVVLIIYLLKTRTLFLKDGWLKSAWRRSLCSLNRDNKHTGSLLEISQGHLYSYASYLILHYYCKLHKCIYICICIHIIMAQTNAHMYTKISLYNNRLLHVSANYVAIIRDIKYKR